MKEGTNKYIKLLSEGNDLIRILREVSNSVPPNTNVYVLGGGSRNSVYYSLFGVALPQRDYDLLLLGDLDRFTTNLRAHGFVYGKIRRKDQIVLKKGKFKNAKAITDYVVLDIHRAYETNVLKDMLATSNFTINGFAIPLRHYLSDNFQEYMIAIPNAKEDLKNHQLHLNMQGIKTNSSGLFACLRFMSIGFKSPSKYEIELLLENLPNLEKWRFERNVKKVFGYVGGENKARELVKKLGINIDIFDFAKLKEFAPQSPSLT